MKNYISRVVFLLAIPAAFVANSTTGMVVLWCTLIAAIAEYLVDFELRRDTARDIRCEMAVQKELLETLSAAVRKLEAAPKVTAPTNHAELAELKTRLDRVCIAVGVGHIIPKKGEA